MREKKLLTHHSALCRPDQRELRLPSTSLEGDPNDQDKKKLVTQSSILRFEHCNLIIHWIEGAMAGEITDRVVIQKGQFKRESGRVLRLMDLFSIVFQLTESDSFRLFQLLNPWFPFFFLVQVASVIIFLNDIFSEKYTHFREVSRMTTDRMELHSVLSLVYNKTKNLL